MFAKKAQFDCLIVGGGPAGCVLACTLASWGKSVCLLEKSGGPHPFAVQSISATATAILKRNGIMTSVREHGHARSRKRILIWGDGTPQVLNFSKEECGTRVDRDLLDPDLRNLARAMNVTVVEGAQITQPLPKSGSGEVVFEVDKKEQTVGANVIVVACGRKHRPDFLPLALEHASPDLFALTATIQCDRKSRDIDVVEAIEKGWFWWFAGPETSPKLALFSSISPRDWRDAAKLAEDVLARSLKGTYSLERGSMRYLNATPRLVTTESGVLLIGDAACTVDPLLGIGLESTILAAESAAVCVNTMLEVPELRDECATHLSNLEKNRYFGNLSSALSLYLREARYSDQGFWSQRHDLCDVQFDSEGDAELPMKLKVAETVGRFPTLRRKGRILERVIGMGKPGGPVHQSALGIPVSQILDLVAENRWTDDVLASAGHHHDLYVHSRAKLTRALTELCRLGILEPGEDAA